MPHFSVRCVLFWAAFPSHSIKEEKLGALVAWVLLKRKCEEKVIKVAERHALDLRHVLMELYRNRKQIDKSQKQQQKRTAKQIEEIKRMVKWRACKCE